MLEKTIIFSLFLLIFISPAFAQEEVPPEFNPEEPAFGNHDFADNFFDNVGEFAKSQVNGSTYFDEEKKQQIRDVTDAGVESGQNAFHFWYSFHEFIINAIFAGSPIPFGIGIAVVVSFVLSSIIVSLILWAFIKKVWKIILAIIAVIAIIMIAGIELPSI